MEDFCCLEEPVLIAMEPDSPLTSLEIGNHLPCLIASSRFVKNSGAPRPEHGVIATSKLFQYTRLQNNQIRVLRISMDPDTKLLICNFDVRRSYS